MGWAPFESETVMGRFVEAEFKNDFEWEKRTEEDFNWDWNPEYPDKIWVYNGTAGDDCGYRIGKVMKTVAYVVIDIDDEGIPVVGKWKIKEVWAHG